MTTSARYRFVAFAVTVMVLVSTSSLHAQVLTTLHTFSGYDGSSPGTVTLAQGQDGALYGTTLSGAQGRLGGVIFRIATDGSINLMHAFSGFDGWHPISGVVLGSNGMFYGNTYSRGSYEPDGGTLFSLGSNGGFKILDIMPQRLENPSTELVEGRDGNFYGVSPGKHQYVTPGAVFRMTPNGTLTLLHIFTRTYDGGNPASRLILAPDGDFYGTTSTGGSKGCGTIYRINTAGILTTLHNFSGSDGCTPFANLVVADDGNFYGTTYGGGYWNYGTVFRFSLSGKLTTLHSFALVDGASPYCGLLQATDGKLYGSTDSGGRNNYGTLYFITKSGAFHTVYLFDRLHGIGPEGGLMQHTNGRIYGTTSFGGLSNDGTVYELDLGLPPFVKTVVAAAHSGDKIGILGQGFLSTSSVIFNNVPAAFIAESDTYLSAWVPTGASTGLVRVTTSSGTMVSNTNFQVLP